MYLSCTKGSAVRQFTRCVGLVILVLLCAASLRGVARADDHTVYFPETGMSVSFGFKRFFEQRGGLEIFGYPITPEIQENGFTVQYFQRARFEYHPEHAGTRYEVQLGLLGDILTSDRNFAKVAPVTNTADVRYFPETGHTVRGAFLRFFNARGGLDIFGYPVSEVVDEDGQLVQYFQRSRFEYHPQFPAEFQITLGLLGEELAERVGPRGRFWIDGLLPAPLINQAMDVRVAVQNVGIGRWASQGPAAVSVGYRWLDSSGAEALVGERVPLPNLVLAGSVAQVRFGVVAPGAPGTYTLQWDLWQEGRGWAAARDPSAATRQVVTIHAPAPPPTPVPTPASTPNTVSPSITSEDGMTIRVGVFSTTEQSMRISGNGGFRAEDESGKTARAFEADEIVTVTHLPESGRYRLLLSGETVAEVANFVRFIAEGNTILSVPDMPRYQQYRNIVEVRYSAYSERLWAINELPMEYYVKGIGEEPESFPAEGLKAATVAYRTYALSHMDPQWAGLGSLGASEPFDIGASHAYVPPYVGSHQWYLGYYRETLGGNLEAAANATRGQFLTYDGKVIRAAYYSRADGMTRSWQEVWGGPGFPWAVAVADPASEGMTLHGHGVGMPLQSTKILAEQGMTYDRMLKMYYTGVELTKLY